MILRRGFTLVELLVSVVLIDLGLLSLVAGSALVVRRHNEMRLRAAAERTASNRLQVLAAGACASTAGDAVVERGMVERWAADVRPNGFRELRDSVVFSVAGREQHVAVHTRAPC
jgi:prepilin-type N-terminal cleavage/methylation domain-containing protein